MSPMHSEYSTLVEYLETIADLPWNRSSDASISLAAAEAQLAEDHFGMTKVKVRVTLSLSLSLTLTLTLTLPLTLTLVLVSSGIAS